MGGPAELEFWLQRALRDRIDLNTVDIEGPPAATRRLAISLEALTILVQDIDGRAILKAAELKQCYGVITDIRNIADAPDTEERLQKDFYNQPWIFGDRFIDAVVRRRFVDGDELEIPLIRADGALHIVELKRTLGASGVIK